MRPADDGIMSMCQGDPKGGKAENVELEIKKVLQSSKEVYKLNGNFNLAI